MRMRASLIAVVLLFATVLFAQQPALKSGEVLVRVETPLGNMDLAIDTKHAPITAKNFLKYVDEGFYNKGRFHRATRPDNYTPHPPNRPPMALIQGDINPAHNGDRFPAIKLERTTVTGLKHVVGSVSMPRPDNPPDSARSGFCIHLDAQPSLDFGGKRFDDGQGSATFGRVVAGMDVAKKIQEQHTNGQNLDPPVEITRVYRVRPLPVVTFETEKGKIDVEIDTAHAPITGENFLRYVHNGFYDGGIVNRSVRPDNTVRHDIEIQVIQFQINPARDHDEYPPIPLERTSVTGLKHVNGVLSTARDGPDTATGSFSIVFGEQPSMNYGGKRNADGQGFAVFGHVIRGMDVAKAIQASHTGQTGPFKTESLDPPIKILKAYQHD